MSSTTCKDSGTTADLPFLHVEVEVGEEVDEGEEGAMRGAWKLSLWIRLWALVSRSSKSARQRANASTLVSADYEKKKREEINIYI
jgi:hypothetical protein